MLTVDPQDIGLLTRFTSHSQPQSTFNIAGRTLEIEQRLRESVGAVVWDAALVLSRYLEDCNQPHGVYPDAVRLQGKRVLELGTGTGIVGMVAYILGAQEVVLTDREEILNITHDNLQHNLPKAVAHPDATVAAGGDPRVVIKPLLWGAGQEDTLGEPFDYVFAADLLYNSEHHDALVRTLVGLCTSTSTTIILVQKWRETSKESSFFMLAEMAGLKYEVLELHKGIDNIGLWRWSGFPSDQEGIQIYRLRQEI